MTSNPLERRTDRPHEENAPAEEGISDAQVTEQLEQDPEEVPNATAEDADAEEDGQD